MKSDRKRNFKVRPAHVLLAFSIIAVGITGCSTATTSAQWAEPDDMGGEFSVIDDSVNGWSKKIGGLPLEIHGNLPSSSALTNRVSGNVSPAMQRVVIYVDGTVAPEREDFCSVAKAFRPVVNNRSDQQVTLRAALCDGPRIVSFARKSFDKTAEPAHQVASIESALVRDLHTPFSFLDVDD